jgi:rare lipoprotein A (peptidoglycan hydrolase)
MIEKVALLLSLVSTGQLGMGTVFGSSRWDKANPHSGMACNHREIDDRSLVVAHNTLPCRSRVWVYNPRTGRSAIALVMDRGPRHAMVDLSKAVAKKLRHNGMESVLLVPLPSGKPAAPITLARSK